MRQLSDIGMLMASIHIGQHLTFEAEQKLDEGPFSRLFQGEHIDL